MRIFYFFLLLFFIATSLASAQFSVDSVQYHWPTDASPYLSGTFGETRSQHFHAALDIKTWGRRGYDVFATRDGRLHRIVIGPGGYGKAVYLKHSDGSYSVYAHLLSFNKQIQQLADSIRFRDYSYKIDVVLDSLNIRINQGDMIGYSGATGIGPPHLHFELRTPSEKPFNPLLTNFSIPDDISPQFSGLALEPLSPNSRIQGENKIYRTKASRRSGFYDFGTVEISGPVGLAVDVFDQANRVHNAYAVYDLKLKNGEQLLFHSQVDSFSYEETNQMFLDRIYPLLYQSGEAYQRLYIKDGNTLSFYKTGKQKARLNLPEGSHTLSILAEDYAGNRSEAHVTLNVTTRSPYGSGEKYHSTGSYGTNGSVQGVPPADSWQWHPNWINLNSNSSQPYRVFSINHRGYAKLQKVGPNSSLRLNQSDLLAIQRAGYQKENEVLHLYRLVPDKSGRIYGSGISTYATFPANSLFDTLSVGITGTTFTSDSIQIEIHPTNQPLKNEFELTHVLKNYSEADSILAFYQFNERKNKLNHMPTQSGGPVLKSKADKLGTYYILSDTTAPDIHSPRILKRADGTLVGMVRAKDNRSGIDYRTAEFYINGIRGIAEFEPEDDRILYYHPDFSPSKRYQFRILVADMVGNRIEKVFTVN